MERDFSVASPDRLWLTDITEHDTAEGKVYCAAVLDAYSRRIVGLSIDHNMRTELVVDALGMAVLRSSQRPDAYVSRVVPHLGSPAICLADQRRTGAVGREAQRGAQCVGEFPARRVANLWPLRQRLRQNGVRRVR